MANPNSSVSANETGCIEWQPTNHAIIHVGNAFVCIGLLVWNRISGALLLHSLFVLGFLLRAVWAWMHLCTVDVFSWNFAFAVVNFFHLIFILYSLQPKLFSPELEDIYESVFKPLRVPRSMFKKLTHPDMCSLRALEPGEKYAVRRLTNTDKLSLLISGTLNVYNNSTLLHQVDERQFLDSPEFESNVTGEDKYQVTIVAVDCVRYIQWCKQGLDAVLMKEPYLGVIMGLLIGRDITNKLYALNEKAHPAGMATRRPDIRLPSLASSHRSGSHSVDTQSPVNLSTNASCASVSGCLQDDDGSRDNRSEDFQHETPPNEGSLCQNWEVSSRNSVVDSASGMLPACR